MEVCCVAHLTTISQLQSDWIVGTPVQAYRDIRLLSVVQVGLCARGHTCWVSSHETTVKDEVKVTLI